MDLDLELGRAAVLKLDDGQRLLGGLGDPLDDLELPADLAPGERRVEVDPDARCGERDDPSPPTLDRERGADVEMGILAPHLGKTLDLVHREQLDEGGVPLAEGLHRSELPVDLLADRETHERLLDRLRKVVPADLVRPGTPGPPLGLRVLLLRELLAGRVEQLALPADLRPELELQSDEVAFFGDPGGRTVVSLGGHRLAEPGGGIRFSRGWTAAPPRDRRTA